MVEDDDFRCFETELNCFVDNLAGYIAQGADFDEVTTGDEFYEEMEEALGGPWCDHFEQEEWAEHIRDMIEERLSDNTCLE